MPNPVESACRKVGGIIEVLPESLEQKARSELFKACGKISQKAQAKARDLEHLARAELGQVSKETWTQIATLLGDAAKKHSAAPAKPPYERPQQLKYKAGAVHDATKGQGDQMRVKLPVRIANGLDVAVLVNIDKAKAMRGNIDLFGIGLGATHKVGDNTRLDVRVLVDTTETRNHGGSVLLTVDF